MANQTSKIAEVRYHNGIAVKRFQIATTTTIVHQAWEPSTIRGPHSSVTTIDGSWYGRIGTDPDPGLYNHLPVGPERSAAVKAAYAQRYAVAYAAIIACFPETADGIKSDGEIITKAGE